MAHPIELGTSGPFDLVAAAIVDARASGPADGNSQVIEDAAAGEGLTAAEHCAAANYSCCKARLRSRWRAASGRGPSIPD